MRGQSLKTLHEMKECIALANIPWNEQGCDFDVQLSVRGCERLNKRPQLDPDCSLVFEKIVQGGEVNDVLCMLVEHIEQNLPGYKCAILLLDEARSHMGLAAAPNLSADFHAEVDCKKGSFIAVDAMEYWADYKALSVRHGMKVCRSETIFDSGKRKLGMLVLHCRSCANCAEIDANFLRQACSLAAIAIERKHSEDLIRHQASFDALTDLPNRRMFVDRLRTEILRAGSKDRTVTLLFIDLDHFKKVNDSLGHVVGDELLIVAAARIRHRVGDSVLVARLGGDEFVVLIPDVEDVSHPARLAQDIAEAMAVPFQLLGHVAYVSASIGIASYPSDADGPDSLVKCADQAMYAAKETGRNGFQFYSAELAEIASERLELEHDLRYAIRRGELELNYQPKALLGDGALIGSEALMRWRHPVRGVVMPDKFVRIAEECGLIMELGDWVLHQACKQAGAWNGNGRPLHKVAINLSPRQFQDAHLYEHICAILEEHACLPEWIELEITESLLLQERIDILNTLNSFYRRGISIAIDDFGTGYSALSYLVRFPINTLKIDRLFTQHVTENGYHAEVIKAILSIASSLNLQVVAEGVETEEQARALHGYGCHVAQGYLFGKPMPKENIEDAMITDYAE